MQSCVHIRSSVFPKVGKKWLCKRVLMKTLVCAFLYAYVCFVSEGSFLGRLSASARPTALIVARRRPSTPRPRGKAAETHNKRSALQPSANTGCVSIRKLERHCEAPFRLAAKIWFLAHPDSNLMALLEPSKAHEVWFLLNGLKPVYTQCATRGRHSVVRSCIVI